MKPVLSLGESQAFADVFKGGLATSRSRRGPVGMTGGRLSVPEGFEGVSLSAEGGGADPVPSIEGSLCLYGGTLPKRGPEGTFGGMERSAAGRTDGLGSRKGSSFLAVMSVDGRFVVGVRLGRVGREEVSERAQLS